jgi:ArsR family transcriptional regulator
METNKANKIDRTTRPFIPIAAEGSGRCCSITHVPLDVEATAGAVKLLAALADPTRLQIVQMLSGLEEPLCVCDIQGHFELGQPTISHHLKVLRDADLVKWEKRGLWVHYSLNTATMERASSFLQGIVRNARQPVAAGAR